MNITEQNLLTEQYYETPKYKPDPKFRCIKAYYPNSEDVILVGEADPNYIFWMSLTKIGDTETNCAIFAYLSQTEPTVFGSDSRVIRAAGYTYAQLQSFYMAELTCAEDILNRRRSGKQKAKQRGRDKQILRRLKSDLETLSRVTGDPVADYRQHEALIREIESQTDLRCSDNPAVTDAYNRLMQRCSDLYNAYMTEVR